MNELDSLRMKAKCILANVKDAAELERIRLILEELHASEALRLALIDAVYDKLQIIYRRNEFLGKGDD